MAYKTEITYKDGSYIFSRFKAGELKRASLWCDKFLKLEEVERVNLYQIIREEKKNATD